MMDSTTQQFRIRGHVDAVQAVIEELTNDPLVTSLQIAQTAPTTTFLDRQPDRQVEIVDVVVNVVISLASGALLEFVKARVETYRKKQIQVEVVQPPVQSDESETRKNRDGT